MATQQPIRQTARGVSRRELMQAGLAAGITMSAWPPSRPVPVWGVEAGAS